MKAFYTRDGTAFTSHEHTRGPWHVAHQHGGPPSALVAQLLQQRAGDTHQLSRLTITFARPVPIAPLTVDIRPQRLGREVQRYTATVAAGEQIVMEASALFVRKTPDAVPPSPARLASPWPDPDTLPSFTFPFFAWDEGYHTAVDIRLVTPPWGRAPMRCWAKLQVPLIAGETTTPEAHAIALADAESGIGPPHDPTRYAFPNADLTVYFGRTPSLDTTSFIGLDIEAFASQHGTGLATARLLDAHGTFGRSAQALVVRAHATGH